MVFAHYMVCFFNSKEFYKREIELAQRHGIDGFALNCGDWAQIDGKTGQLTSTNYREAADRIYAAAQELNTGFKLFFSADVNGLQNLPVQMGDMVQRYYKHPNQFHWNGKAVISAWAGTPQTFADAISKMKKNGFNVVFVPFVTTSHYPTSWSPELVRSFFTGQEDMDGLFNFAADNTTEETLRNNAIGRRITRDLGKIYMAGAAPAYNSANLRDFHGMDGYGAAWKGMIDDNADLVELVTWNDYTEDSNLMPFRWSVDQNKPYFDRDESFLDVTAYYSAWYKAGRAPALTQDKLYYVYRNRSKRLTQGWDDETGAWVDITAKKWPFDQFHDDVQDNIYVTTFLTTPAKVTVDIGSQTIVSDRPAGVSTFAVPLQPGVPHFTVSRLVNGEPHTVIDVLGRKQIIDQPTKENSLVGMHLANRTWTGGAAAGKALRFEASSAKLGTGTTIVKLGASTLVQTTEQPGSGLTIPLTGLAAGTYSIRIIYNNPAPVETRLTVTADGPFSNPTDHPYMIPAFLPPTPGGHTGAASFLWSLYNTTTFLSINWQPGPDKLPTEDDHGTAQIEAVELTRVDPVSMPAVKPTLWPELVAIPGGAFTMGDAKGAPNETPAHPVTLSPFWMGKTEVTNEEYERYDPTHKALRDSFSWRDHDPVIYVSWNDGAKYTNWLSRQTGLTPVYDEKTWAMGTKANGFRMPTEAEWEYCATGRDQGRTYPWGNEPPDPGRGNFPAIQDMSAGGASRLGADTTAPVGSFPNGESRDGIDDLAGNVSEWCSDTLQPYSPQAQMDPCIQTPGNYRVIRGGSFGYYGITQRARMREYNNPGYPGYVYIGLRVALPAPGASRILK